MFNHETLQDIVLKYQNLILEVENIYISLSSGWLLLNVWNNNTHALEMKCYPAIEK